MPVTATPPKPPTMTADEFLLWTERLPEGTRYELVNGEVRAMTAGTLGHGEVKGLIFRRLADAVERNAPDCQAIVDSVGVRASVCDTFIPDVLVRCGEIPDRGVREINDPVIVVEVASPSIAQMDSGEKLIGYFSLPSVRHYLLVYPATRRVVHHARQPDGTILTAIRGSEPILLDPPVITLADFLPPAPDTASA